MQPDDPRFLKRKVKSGSIDVHPTEKSLILSYELEYQVIDDHGEEILKEKRDLEKIIALPTLNTKTDSAALAKAVIEKCELLHPSKLAEVEQLIYYLKNRKLSPKSGISRSNSATVESKPDPASIAQIDTYIEMLYEDIPSKIKGSSLILQLAREPDNLEFLSRNVSVLSVVARVLREDWKKSIVLSTNLVYIFFCFSSYIDFHPLILHYKIGSLCMDIIDHELVSYDKWQYELQATENPMSEVNISEVPRSKIPEPVRPRSGNWAMISSTTSDDLTNPAESTEERKQLSDTEKIKRYKTLIKKQEQLLRVAFYLLLNISVDEVVEEKMAKKNIVYYLVKTLDRENEDLLLLVMTFLKKLSIFEVNKDEIDKLGVINKLLKLLDSDNADLVHLTLKLLFNLSFDEQLRHKMVERGLVPTFVNLLSDDRHQTIIIKLLYHLSIENKVKAMFSYTDCVSLIIDMILLCKDDTCNNDMIALGINLAINESNALQMVENKRLQNLMARAFKFQNFLLMKMIRNISEHKVIQPQFVDYIGDLSNALRESKYEAFIQECLGILGNIVVSDVDYARLFNHFNLLSWFHNVLKPKHADDELMLQGVIFLGNAATDKSCAVLFCESNLMRDLIELLKIHQEDDEIVYQIIYVFLQVLQHDETQNHVIMETEAPAYLIDLYQDQNKVVSNICSTCLDIISEKNSDWARRIKIEKFRNHNSQWLQMVESHAADEADFDDELTELPPYMNAEFLATHSVPTCTDQNNAESHEEDLPLGIDGIRNRFETNLELGSP